MLYLLILWCNWLPITPPPVGRESCLIDAREIALLNPRHIFLWFFLPPHPLYHMQPSSTTFTWSHNRLLTWYMVKGTNFLRIVLWNQHTLLYLIGVSTPSLISQGRGGFGIPHHLWIGFVCITIHSITCTLSSSFMGSICHFHISLLIDPWVLSWWNYPSSSNLMGDTHGNLCCPRRLTLHLLGVWEWILLPPCLWPEPLVPGKFSFPLPDIPGGGGSP